MSDNAIIVIDAARARFFIERFETREPARPGLPARSGYQLDEERDLVNPATRLRDGERYSESRPGSQRGPAGAPGHTTDDRRDAQVKAQDKAFAAEIASQVEGFCKECSAERLILVADPRMMGFLRPELESLSKKGIERRDLTKDLSRMRPTQIQKHLIKAGVLPWRPEAGE
jgi:protein required for attachment to host cells